MIDRLVPIKGDNVGLTLKSGVTFKGKVAKIVDDENKEVCSEDIVWIYLIHDTNPNISVRTHVVLWIEVVGVTYLNPV